MAKKKSFLDKITAQRPNGQFATKAERQGYREAILQQGLNFRSSKDRKKAVETRAEVAKGEALQLIKGEYYLQQLDTNLENHLKNDNTKVYFIENGKKTRLKGLAAVLHLNNILSKFWADFDTDRDEIPTMTIYEGRNYITGNMDVIIYDVDSFNN